MKTLLILAVLGAGVWYLMTRAKQNAEVQKITDAPARYVHTLQNDLDRAKTVQDAASKRIKEQSQEVEKAVDAQ